MATEASFYEPHEEAAAIIRGKPAVTREVFDKLLPELRGRAITVTGLEGLSAIERVRDEIAAYARGQREDGTPVTWDDAKAEVVKVLDDSHFGAEAAERRATLLLRTHGFQAYQAANWRVAQEDDDTTHLQYLATEDSKVRDTHLALNGLILPKNDPFWEKHYPPWEWGCRCRVRPMNPDLVEDERQLDQRRKPEDRLVLDGPVLERLRQGQVVRGELRDRDGRTVGMGAHDVTPPSQRPGGDKASYQWNPEDLRLKLSDLKARHDPAVWDEFARWGRGHEASPRLTVLEWADGEQSPEPTLANEEAHSRKLRHEVGVIHAQDGRQQVRRASPGLEIRWTPDELAAMDGAVVSHNHPTQLGPNLGDFGTAIMRGAAEFRVVTDAGAWVMRPVVPLSTAARADAWAEIRTKLLPIHLEQRSLGATEAARLMREVIESDGRFMVTFEYL